MVEAQPNTEKQAPRMLGHYQMLEQIGQGGMAVVYKGLQPSLNRTVAIKVLPERFARTEELLVRFDREANIAAQLNHPNIVQVIDRGKEGETLFIVMEFVKGVGLDQLIRDEKLTVAQSLDYAMQICDALEYAHSKGVVHRDLKPSNILVDTENGRAKISDFGIAAIEATGSELSTLTRENTALGTINYMSPEQRLNSHTVTFESDIFSFGVVLYEMLTGKLPLGHFKLPSFINHQVPIGFDDVVKKCLAPVPADRYQGAGEIKAELGRITGRHLRPVKKGSPLPAGPGWISGRISDWLSGRVRYVVGGVAALAIVVAVAHFAHGHHSPSRQSPPSSVSTIDNNYNYDDLNDMAIPESDAAGNRAATEFNQALQLIRQHKPGDAIPLLRDVQATGKRPLNENAQFLIGRAYSDEGEYKTALAEYDTFLNAYSDSPKRSEALMAKCNMMWKTMHTSGTWSKKFYEGEQRELVNELKSFIETHSDSSLLPKAYQLMAEVCDKPELSDYKTEAYAMFQRYTVEPTHDRDLLYGAAELAAGKGKDPELAAKAYERFVRDFPEDPRRATADSELKRLK